MSVLELKKIIEKMVEDKVFEEEVFSNPEAALQGYDISGEEREKLLSLDREKIKKIAMDLDKRLSKDESWWVDSIND